MADALQKLSEGYAKFNKQNELLQKLQEEDFELLINSIEQDKSYCYD